MCLAVSISAVSGLDNMWYLLDDCQKADRIKMLRTIIVNRIKKTPTKRAKDCSTHHESPLKGINSLAK